MGRRKPARRLCAQGKWFEFFDPEAQVLKREARNLLKQIKRLRASHDVGDLICRLRALRAGIRKRIKHAIHERAEETILQSEQLKSKDPRSAWRQLKSLLSFSKKIAGLSEVQDAKGAGCARPRGCARHVRGSGQGEYG